MKKILIPAITALSMALAPAAGAITQSRAIQLAKSYQATWCGKGFGWYCLNPNGTNGGTYGPDCWLTGVNLAWHGQWQCTGYIWEGDYFTLAGKVCDIHDGWDPWGSGTNGSESNCTSASID